MWLKERIENVIKTIDTATTIGDERLAWSALGYSKAIFEMIDDALETQEKTEHGPLYKFIERTEEHTVEAVNKAPVTLEEYCEEQKEKLKHDIIAEEEKTLYLHRAYLKDEVCKRWPNTNTMIKKILHGNGIKNIEDFYEYFTIYGNWKLNDWLGLCTDDVIKFHNLYLTLNEESGCPANEKLIAYMPVDTNRSGMATRMVRYLENMDICTKSQLRWYVRNIGDIPYTKGVGDDRIDALNNKVKEELAFHEM